VSVSNQESRLPVSKLGFCTAFVGARAQALGEDATVVLETTDDEVNEGASLMELELELETVADDGEPETTVDEVELEVLDDEAVAEIKDEEAEDGLHVPNPVWHPLPQ
jgi:hypothetical protein